MIESIQELRDLIANTSLANSRIAITSAPDCKETIFAIEVLDNSLEDWREMRSLTPVTGRWPVITLLHGSNLDKWTEKVTYNDLFSRFYFREEKKDSRTDDSPNEIILAAEGVDATQLFNNTDTNDSWPADEDYITTAIDDTYRQFGKCPIITDPRSFLDSNALFTCEDVDRWLFSWEINNCTTALELPNQGLSHISWYEPKHESQVLLLMPSPRGWETAAYINWFASYRYNSQSIVALLHEWNVKYGAELVAHFGTMLQLQIKKRPKTAEEAFNLAQQQQMISPCTTMLTGTSLRNHARALLHTDKWFLHERP